MKIKILLETVQKEKVKDYSDHSKKKEMRHQDFPITGIFAHILEDGICEVRCETIKCLGVITQQNKEFLQACRDIIFYMLNDEDDVVRINVILVLVEMMKKVTKVSS